MISFFKRSTKGLHVLQVAGVAASASILFGGESRVAKNEAAANIHRAGGASSFGGLSPCPPVYIFQPNPNLEIAFDARTRNPIYVLERLTPSCKQGMNSSSLKRPNSFYEEKSLPEEFRSRVSHYRHSGFDRGHLAAAANYMHTSQKELNDTFNLINVSPQNHSMNASIWAQLERWTLKVVEEEENADTYVVSGPLWMPAKQSGEKLFEFQFSAIGTPPSLVSVPTHLFKIVVAVDQKSQQLTKFACFVIPNKDFDKRDGKRHSLEGFLVPWSNLEAVSGLHFFSSLTKDPNWKEKANRLTNDIIKSISQDQQRQRLLLTDGSTSTAGNNAKWRFKADNSPLAHFCANQRCR